MRLALDLTSAIADLEAANADVLVKAIKKFHAVSSVSVDLNEVKVSLFELDHIDNNEIETGSPHIAGAVLVHAIVTYARASHSDPISRWRADVNGAYNHGELQMHREVVAIRDKCIAHFGFGDDWNDERVIYKIEDTRLGVTTAHRRSSFRRHIRDNLQALTDRALPHITGLSRLRADELINIIILSPSDVIAIMGPEQEQSEIVR